MRLSLISLVIVAAAVATALPLLLAEPPGARVGGLALSSPDSAPAAQATGEDRPTREAVREGDSDLAVGAGPTSSADPAEPVAMESRSDAPQSSPAKRAASHRERVVAMKERLDRALEEGASDFQVSNHALNLNTLCVAAVLDEQGRFEVVPENGTLSGRAPDGSHVLFVGNKRYEFEETEFPELSFFIANTDSAPRGGGGDDEGLSPATLDALALLDVRLAQALGALCAEERRSTDPGREEGR